MVGPLAKFAGTCAAEMGRASIDDSGPLMWFISATAAATASVVGTVYGLMNSLSATVRGLFDEVAAMTQGKTTTYQIQLKTKSEASLAALLNAPVPPACDHPAGRLVKGVLPGIPVHDGGVWPDFRR